MRIYETTFVLNPQTDDATLDSQVAKVADLVTGNGGKILAEKRIGTRRLAYPVRKLTQGYYSTFVYEGNTGLPAVLDRHFRLGDEFLRHLTIQFEGDLNAFLEERGVTEPEERHDRPRPKEQAERRPEARPAAAAESKPEPEVTPEPVARPTEPSTEPAPTPEEQPEPEETISSEETVAPEEPVKREEEPGEQPKRDEFAEEEEEEL